MAHRSPKELIELYWTEVWNNRKAEMIRELCADPIIRHDPGSVTALSVEDQIARIRQQSAHAEPFFEHEDSLLMTLLQRSIDALRDWDLVPA